MQDFRGLSLAQVKEAAGIRTDSEGTSSDGSRSRTQSANTPSPTGHGELVISGGGWPCFGLPPEDSLALFTSTL